MSFIEQCCGEEGQSIFAWLTHAVDVIVAITTTKVGRPVTAQGVQLVPTRHSVTHKKIDTLQSETFLNIVIVNIILIIFYKIFKNNIWSKITSADHIRHIQIYGPVQITIVGPYMPI